MIIYFVGGGLFFVSGFIFMLFLHDLKFQYDKIIVAKYIRDYQMIGDMFLEMMTVSDQKLAKENIRRMVSEGIINP